MMMRMMTMI